MVNDVAYVNLPDKRLEERLAVMVEKFSQAPNQSIPQAFDGDWAQTKGAYRFLKNDRVTREALLAGQREATRERLSNRPLSDRNVVLLVQDTTSFNYSHHPTTSGLGRLENDSIQGFFAHSSLLVTPEGVPLGLLDQQVWVRDDEHSSSERHERAFEEKESHKWVEGLVDLATHDVVTVCDQESDIYEFMDEVLNQKMHWLIRARHPRTLASHSGNLHETVRAMPVRSTFSIEFKPDPNQAPRTAQLEMRYGRVVLQAPDRAEVTHPQIPVQVIEVYEPHPPTGEDPVHWILLTTLPIPNVATARQYVRWYSYRWLIERFHYVLKSGCRIEDKRLSERVRLERFLGVANLVAIRLLWLTYEARKSPEAPCTRVLSSAEWRALLTYHQRRPVKDMKPPTLQEAIRMIAKLGGFLGRKNDGDPGVKSLWRGWQRLRDIVTTWKIMHPPSKDVGNA